MTTKEQYKIKIDEQNKGWICPRCGNSNSPFIFSCDKCTPKYTPEYPDFPIYPSTPYPYTPNITVTCKSENDRPNLICEKLEDRIM
jgi:hypothetical protein